VKAVKVVETGSTRPGDGVPRFPVRKVPRQTEPTKIL
jgi:hypothetical protein